MPDGEDYVLRPVMAGLCSYESVLSGGLDISDIARLNDALDVRSENERRIAEHLRRLHRH